VDCSSIGGGVLGVGIGAYLMDLWMRVMRPPPVFVPRSWRRMVKFGNDGGLDETWSLDSWMRAMWILWVESRWLIWSAELVIPFELNWRIFRDEVGGPGLGWMSPAWARRVGSQGRDDFLLAGMVVWIDAESSVVEMRVEFGG